MSKIVAYSWASTNAQDVKNQRHEILEYGNKDRERIEELLSHGVPQTRIIKRHLQYSTTKSLSYYIRTGGLRNASSSPNS